MADHGDGGGGSTTSDVLFFLLVLVFLAVVFFLSGAAKRANVSSLFVPFPGTSTSTFGVIGAPSVNLGTGGFDISETNTITDDIATIQKNIAELKSTPNSPYAGKVGVTTVWSTRGTTPEEEYVIIKASSKNTEGVTISGWQLVSAVSRLSARIPNGTELYAQGYGYTQSVPIVLKPGEEAIISTGRSPIGISFHVNSCSGYLTQFQKFVPRLLTSCPRPQDDLNAQPDRLLFADNDCYNYLASLGNCRIDLSPPTTLSPACRNFIYNRVTYQGCIATHSNDAKFTRPEWRVYLGYSSNLWRDAREAVVLVDENNKLVDSLTY